MKQVAKIILVVAMFGVLSGGMSWVYGMHLSWPPYILAGLYIGIGSSVLTAIGLFIWGIDWVRNNVQIK